MTWLYKEAAEMSKSKRRSLAAIGDSCVIPANAGIQWLPKVKNGFPLARERRIWVIPAKAGIQWLATNDPGFPLARERRL
jgi:hypothetical protein